MYSQVSQELYSEMAKKGKLCIKVLRILKTWIDYCDDPAGKLK